MEQALNNRGAPRTVIAEPEALRKRIWSVAGGKGGTGKTIISANLAIGMALLGYRVIAIDADLGVPNLHNYFGIRRPSSTLDDFLSRRIDSLSDTILETPLPNLGFIGGASDLIGIANMPYQRKMRLIRHINKLEADIVIVDLGAGITNNTIDFFNLSSRGIVISNPEPNANQDAYFFLKNALYRRMRFFSKQSEPIKAALEEYKTRNGNGTFDFSRFSEFVSENGSPAKDEYSEFLEDFRPRLIMNKVRTFGQSGEGKWFVNLVKTFLGIEIDYVGSLRFDKNVIVSAEKTFPFIFRYPKKKVTKDLYAIVDTLNDTSMPKHAVRNFRQFRSRLLEQKDRWL